MRTDFYEADPFGGSKGEHYVTIDSDYRWEKGDDGIVVLGTSG